MRLVSITGRWSPSPLRARWLTLRRLAAGMRLVPITGRRSPSSLRSRLSLRWLVLALRLLPRLLALAMRRAGLRTSTLTMRLSLLPLGLLPGRMLTWLIGLAGLPVLTLGLARLRGWRCMALRRLLRLLRLLMLRLALGLPLRSRTLPSTAARVAIVATPIVVLGARRAPRPPKSESSGKTCCYDGAKEDAIHARSLACNVPMHEPRPGVPVPFPLSGPHRGRRRSRAACTMARVLA